MGAVDFILNLAALLLWAGTVFLHSATRSDFATAPLRTSLRTWHLLAGLAGLLMFRPFLYWQLGPAVDWVPSLVLGPVSIFFRCDLLQRSILFSLVSFGRALAAAYACLLLLSVVNSGEHADPLQRVLRRHLGRVDRWPVAFRLLLPWVGATICWLALGPPLASLELAPAPHSAAQRIEQAFTVGLSIYKVWEYLICWILGVYLVGCYVFFGTHPLLELLNLTARNLLSPFRLLPLRFGRIDLGPLAAIVTVFLLGELASRGLGFLYRRLPL